MKIEREEILNINDSEKLLILLHSTSSNEVWLDTAFPVFERLNELKYSRLGETIVDYCISSKDKVSDTIRRDYLSRWMKSEGYISRPKLINYLLERVKQLSKEEIRRVLQIIWTIGFRDSRIEKRLKTFAGITPTEILDDEIQGLALAVLANLGYPHYKVINQKLEERLKVNGKFTEPDCWAANKTATPQMIQPLVDAAKKSSNTLYFAATFALLNIVNRFPKSAAEVWRGFLSLDEDQRFLFEDNAAQLINLEVTGEYLLSKAGDAFQHRATRNTLMASGRVLKANLPKHLAFFQKAQDKLSTEIFNTVKKIAIEPSGNDSSYNTVESVDKERVWDLILRLGLKESKHWLPSSLENEKTFTLVRLSKIAGYLQVHSVIEVLDEIINNKEINSRYKLGCVRNLGLLPSEQTINILLKIHIQDEYSSDEYILSEIIKSLGAVCMSLQSSQTIWNFLHDLLTPLNIKELCAYTIEYLSRFANSPLPPADQIVDFLKTLDKKSKVFNNLLMSLHAYYKDDYVLEFLRDLAESDYQSSEFTRMLSASGLLKEFPERIEELGFKRENKSWYFQGKLNFLTAFVLYCLYKEDVTFEKVVMNEINDDSFFGPINQLLINFKNIEKTSNTIKKSLEKRVFRFNGPNYTDSTSLNALAWINPKSILIKSFIRKVLNWNSNSRLAYIDSLNEISEKFKLQTKISEVAVSFLSDEDRLVRQGAAKLLRKTNKPELKAFVDSSLKAETIDLYKSISVIDCAFYLDDAGWKKAQRFGDFHPEPLVREYTAEFTKKRKKKKLANSYIEKLLTSKDLLKTWRFGQAITEIGDEEILARIKSNLPTEVYIRDYLLNISDELNKNIEKSQQEWQKKFQLPSLI